MFSPKVTITIKAAPGKGASHLSEFITHRLRALGVETTNHDEVLRLEERRPLGPVEQVAAIQNMAAHINVEVHTTQMPKWEACTVSPPPKKNQLVMLGFMSGYQCFLNVPVEEALDRYLARQWQDCGGVWQPGYTTREEARESLRVVEFDDEFGAYDIGEEYR